MYNYIANATGCSVNDFECVRRADLDVLIKASNDILAVSSHKLQSGYYKRSCKFPPRFRPNFNQNTHTPLLSVLHSQLVTHSYVSPPSCRSNKGSSLESHLYAEVSFVILHLGLAINLSPCSN